MDFEKKYCKFDIKCRKFDILAGYLLYNLFMKMKKILYSILIMSCFAFAVNVASAMPNPWTECGDDISCAGDIAGFNFPLQVKNYSVRAMADMIEFTFPLDKNRTVTVRKSLHAEGIPEEDGIKDISGDYNVYPINKIILINAGIPFSVRGDKTKFYVVNFAAESGYYSIMCNKGLKIKDIKYFYKLLEKTEANHVR